MIITCPECGTKYQLHSNPTNVEKTLQCARCHNKWSPDNGEPQAATMPTNVARRIVLRPGNSDKSKITTGKSKSILRMETAQKLAGMRVNETLKSVALAEEAADPTKLADEQIVEVDQPSDQASDAIVTDGPTDSTGRRHPQKSGWLNIAAAIGALAIFGGGLIYKDIIISTLPETETLYGLVGMEFHRSDLKFADIKTRTEQVDGGEILVVEGLIKNVTDMSVAVPFVRLAMRAADEKEIYSWVIKPEQRHIAAGKKIFFSTIINNPPDNVSDIKLKFTNSDKQHAGLF